MIAPAIPLFHAFGRIGCFLAGCCYGFELSDPIVIASDFVITHFPVQLVESLFNILLFIVLNIVQRYRPNTRILYVYMLSYAVFRFIIEFFRGDVTRGLFFGISTSQLISAIIIVVCVITLYKRMINKGSSFPIG